MAERLEKELNLTEAQYLDVVGYLIEGECFEMVKYLTVRGLSEIEACSMISKNLVIEDYSTDGAL